MMFAVDTLCPAGLPYVQLGSEQGRLSAIPVPWQAELCCVLPSCRAHFHTLQHLCLGHQSAKLLLEALFLFPKKAST